VNAITPTRQT